VHIKGLNVAWTASATGFAVQWAEQNVRTSPDILLGVGTGAVLARAARCHCRGLGYWRVLGRGNGNTVTLAESEPQRRIWSRLASSRAARVAGRVVALTMVALLGSWLGLVLGGHSNAGIGPVETRMALQPSLTGQTVVEIPPLGTLQIDSDRGLLRLDVTVQRIKETDVRAISRDPGRLRDMPNQVSRDLRHAVTVVAVRGLLAAVAGSLLLGLLVFRRLGRAILAGAISLAVLAASGLFAAATWNPDAILEPRYTGLLASAPSLIGTTQDIVTSFQAYRKELARLVANVSQLYQATSHLPTYQPSPETVRVLDVSDIHDNPAAWNVMHSVTDEFHVNFIIDSGDLTDHGSGPENAFAKEIPAFRMPYVFVKGNHDSDATQEAVARQKNAVVLTGKVVTIDGLRLIGAGDPRFTPNLAVEVPGERDVVAMGRRLAATAAQANPPPDIAVVHDPAAAVPLAGAVKLVLAGHLHRRLTQMLPGGTFLFVQGSTGGAGLRALQSTPPTPLEFAVLYFDRATHRLQAWDDITLAGLGGADVQIQRHLVNIPGPGPGQSPSPSQNASPGQATRQVSRPSAESAATVKGLLARLRVRSGACGG
jgi:predicted phosphodiesterase